MNRQHHTNHLLTRFPFLKDLAAGREHFWLNPNYGSVMEASCLGKKQILDAEARLQRFRPVIGASFAETRKSGGLIESQLREIPKAQEKLESQYRIPLRYPLLLKCDDQLPVSGSIKARGGIYEVLCFAERIARSENILGEDDDYRKLLTPEARQIFSSYRIAVGSTGNLGLSIGIMGRALGLQVTVHMSVEAKAWKKKLLRDLSAEVIEHTGSYIEAVAAGREAAMADPRCHFIDDENSLDLFLGYATAGLRLKQQLEGQGIEITAQTPLCIYLPCGVGGGPGGISFGLKEEFGPHVHCFFAEPCQAPAMILGLGTGLHDRISATDINITARTEADGLAVTRPSRLVCQHVGQRVAGCYTITDEHLFQLLALLHRQEQIFLEPSGAAGLAGPWRLLGTGSPHWRELATRAIHLVWATGGGMVPADERRRILAKSETVS